ncbi:olfactory receptor 2T5-like [Ranitomeya variabilis]|uniref:olfactory receptor 2T5-like n=1 Tax=Ranitomeya variabilis TaxID=490064 RepID=UPI00405609BC
MHLYTGLQSLDYILLTAMSYDRYVAICNPLRYSLVLNKKVCVLLAGFSWLLGIIDPLPIIVVLSRLPFCSSWEIDHFFCDLMPLLKVSCGDISKVMTIVFIEGALIGITSFVLILSSYSYIITTVTSMKTALARHKAFSTCSAHLTVILMLYLSLICVYIIPSPDDNAHSKKSVALLNTVLVPILNPILYSLRNKEVKFAVQKLFSGKLQLHKMKQ